MLTGLLQRTRTVVGGGVSEMCAGPGARAGAGVGMTVGGRV